MTGDQAQAAYQKLLTEQQSAMLATVNTDGSPLASYTPFVLDKVLILWGQKLACDVAKF